MKCVRTLLALMIVSVIELAHATNHTSLTVDLAWLQANLSRQDVVVVDTRVPQEYAAGHIAGSVNIPVANTFSSGPRNDLLASISEIKALLRRRPVTVLPSNSIHQLTRTAWKNWSSFSRKDCYAAHFTAVPGRKPWPWEYSMP